MGSYTYIHRTINGVKKTLHRHVMEEHLGRELHTNEHIYHINGNPHDNRIENLIIIKKNSSNRKKRVKEK